MLQSHFSRSRYGCRLPSTPRTDPGVRHYRTGLLPPVVTHRHTEVPVVRTRLGSGDRRPRRCVRPLWCSIRFPLASSLPSTFSAGPDEQPLFEAFLGTMKLSDSLPPCITVVPLGFTVRT